ncbi:MAG: thiamine pyrophosphate-dependent enzyme, partial [Dehalococcoidia bacterium]
WTAGVATGATIESPVLHSADVILGVGLDPVELIPAPWPYAAPLVSLSGWPVDDSTYFGEHVQADLVGDSDDLGGLVEQARRWIVPGDWVSDAGQQFQQQARDELEATTPAEPLGLTPQAIVTIARRLSEAGTIASVDAGAHMLAAVPLWRANQPGELLTSSGLATMGYALPAAIAAALVHPDRAVICFTGDGGLSMVLGELETAARLEVKVIVVVFNDSTLSLIAAKQRPSGQGGTNAVQYRPIDFAGIARASGMVAAAVNDVAEYEDALRAALDRAGPTLIDVRTDPSAYPEVLAAIRGPRPRS